MSTTNARARLTYLDRAADRAALRMTDEGTVTRPAAHNPDTVAIGANLQAAPATVEVYSGPCVVWQEQPAQTRERDGEAFTNTRTKAAFPPGAGRIESGDLLEITDSRNDHLTGQTFVVLDVADRSRGARQMATLLDSERQE